MTAILDGKKLADKILDGLKEEVSSLKKTPTLAVILVGENPASKIYVGFKEKTAKKIGINSIVERFSENIDESVFLAKIEEFNSNPEIDAILIQLPLPKHIDTKKVIESISPKKDVDGFTPENVGKASIGIEPYAYSCTPYGIMTLLGAYDIELEGKHVVIVGRSNIVGKPLSLMCLNKNATVTVCHSKTKNLSEITKTADVLISAVGVNNIIKSDMVKEGVVVVDVGISKSNGKVSGDVDFESVMSKASFITPVPGGVGPMTIATLMQNTVRLARLNEF